MGRPFHGFYENASESHKTSDSSPPVCLPLSVSPGAGGTGRHVDLPSSPVPRPWVSPTPGGIAIETIVERGSRVLGAGSPRRTRSAGRLRGRGLGGSSLSADPCPCLRARTRRRAGPPGHRDHRAASLRGPSPSPTQIEYGSESVTVQALRAQVPRAREVVDVIAHLEAASRPLLSSSRGSARGPGSWPGSPRWSPAEVPPPPCSPDGRPAPRRRR